MSIKRTVELLLDRAKARRVEREAKRALDRGTDPRKPTRNLSLIGRGMEALKGRALALGAAIAGAFAVRKVLDFARTSLQAFGRQERAILRVNSALLNMNQFTEENSEALQASAAALQRVTTAGDEAILEATATIGDLAKELTVGELAQAQKAAIALADTFFDGNLSSAAVQLAKSIGSSVNSLSRYGVEIDTTATQSEKLQQILEFTEGMFLTSQRAATDLSGRYAQLTNSVGDVTESFGGILSHGLGLTDLLLKMRIAVDDFGMSLEENRNEIAGWGTFTIDLLQAVWESVRFIFRALFNLGELIGGELDRAMVAVQRTIAPTLNFILDGLDAIPGVNIPIRMNELTPEQFSAEMARINEQQRKNIEDLTDTVFDLGQAYRDVAESATAAATGTARVAGGGPGAESIPGAEPVDPLTAAIAGITDPAIGGRASRTLTHPAIDQADEIRRQVRATMVALRGDIVDVDPLGILEEQTAATAAFMREGFAGVGEAMVAQLIAGRAEEQFAQGLAALASGIWPPNPAALAAAGKHFAAAAAFRALAGALGAPGVGGGGGGTGGAPGARGTSAPTAQPLPPEVNIFLDPLSPADPDFQRVTLGAVQNAQERFGDNVKVNIRPRSGR